MLATSKNPHDFDRVHEHKLNPPRLVELRNIPQHHFVQQLTGDGSPIEFLPQITVHFDNKNDDKIYIKNTSVGAALNNNGVSYKQVTQCFDISCRPIGTTLASPMQIRLNWSGERLAKMDTNCNNVVLLTFDNNTRKWSELCPQRRDGYFQADVQFFGKFCFCTKPVIRQFLLTEVATSHAILENAKCSVQIVMADDRVDQFGAVLSLTQSVVLEDDLKRVQDSIGIKNVNVGQVFNFNVKGNTRGQNTKDLVSIQHTNKIPSENSMDRQVVLAMIKTGRDGIWKVAESSSSASVDVSMGDSQVMFVETDAGNAQDTQKLEFFGTELDFVMNSTRTNIFVYQSLQDRNRLHVGFQERDASWKLLGKNESIVLKEQSEVGYTIANGRVLAEDSSPKTLNFFANNRTGVDVFVVSAGDASISIGVTDTVTKQFGTVLDCKLDMEDNDSFSPYIQEKVYEHVAPPEIFREYKLEYLKFLSPAEREKYKHINGM